MFKYLYYKVGFMEGSMYRVSSRQYTIIKTLNDYLVSGFRYVDVREVAKALNTNVSDLMRDLAELESKGLIKTQRLSKYLVKLSDLGIKYLNEGLPEFKLLQVLVNLNSRGIKSLRVDELKEVSKLSDDEFSASLGILRRFNVISISRNVVDVSLDNAKIQEFSKYLEDVKELLSRLNEGLIVGSLDSKLQSIKRRGFIVVDEIKELSVGLTDVALEAIRNNLIIAKDIVTVLTPELISSGGWKDVEFKEFDLSIEVPMVYPSRKHPYIEFLNYVRDIVVSMGFEEVKGPHLELEFWNFDVLYVPQYHPARTVTDVYFVKEGVQVRYDVDEEVMNIVKRVHEDGGPANSLGWGYRWDPNKALKLILRTHTTSVSMRTIYERGEGEYRCFSLDRVFRPDTPDPTHLMEFHQLEGIIVGKEVSFKHLLGFFKEFARRLGLGDVIFKPAYFPFTEPSVEGYVKHPKLGWIEVFPGGMFRPEVLRPLKVVNCNVAAWGIGIDRIAMMVLGIDDIRELYSNSLDVIKGMKIPKTLLKG